MPALDAAVLGGPERRSASREAVEFCCHSIGEVGFHIFPGLPESAAELNPDRRIIGIPLERNRRKSRRLVPTGGRLAPDQPDISALLSPTLRPTAVVPRRETGV